MKNCLFVASTNFVMLSIKHSYYCNRNVIKNNPFIIFRLIVIIYHEFGKLN